MSTSFRWPVTVAVYGLSAVVAVTAVVGCKRTEAPPDPLKSQRDAMERAKGVGKTMQKAVDEEGRRSDEEGK